MSGAGADRSPPAKLRRLDSPTGTDPVSLVYREPSPPAGGRGEGGGAHAPSPADGHAQSDGARTPPGGGRETAASLRGGLETTVASEGGLETTSGVLGGLETRASLKGGLKPASRRKGSLETAITRCLEQGRSGKGGPETTTEVMGGLETTSEVLGGLENTSGPKGSLETTVTHCSERGRRNKGGLEATSKVQGGLETTSGPKGSLETTDKVTGSLETAITPCSEQGRRSKDGLETTNEVTGGLDTAVTHCLEQGRRNKGGLETTSEVLGGLETTSEVTGSLETTVTHRLEQGRRSKGGLETTSGPKEGLETTSKVTKSLKTAATGHSEQRTRPKRSLETAPEVPEASVVPKGSLETAAATHLEQHPRGKGSLEPTGEVPGGPEPTVTHCLEQGGGVRGDLDTPAKPEGSLETVAEAKEGLETTTPAGSQQSRGGKRVPEPQGGEAPGARQKGHSPEESAVISLGEDEEEEEEEEEEGPGRYLAALEAVQLELEAVEEQAARAFRRLRAKFWLRRRPHLQRRNRLIQHIPGFWVTAFLNHPQLSAMISDRDEDALSYMTSLQVEEFGQSRPGCRIRFFFSVNPYFQNDVVAKEFVRGPSGHLVSHSTPIRWWQGQDPRSRPHKGPPAPRSFFAWFGDHSFPAGDRVAEIIKEELWPNPLQFYLLGEGAEGTPESESGEDCVVIVDDDEDVQEIPDDGDGSGVEEILTQEPPSPPDGQTTPKRGRD